MRYKNLSDFTKTFYGVEIKPGEVKDIPGNVNDPLIVPWFSTDIEAAPETTPEAPKEETATSAVSAEVIADAENTDSTVATPKSSRKRIVKEA